MHAVFRVLSVAILLIAVTIGSLHHLSENKVAVYNHLMRSHITNNHHGSCSSSASSSRFRVAIVGAGLTGLTAAVELSKSNLPIDVVLIEAAPRLGGRVLRWGDASASSTTTSSSSQQDDSADNVATSFSLSDSATTAPSNINNDNVDHVDAGATFIHGVQGANPIKLLCERYGLQTIPVSYDSVRVFAAPIVVNGEETVAAAGAAACDDDKMMEKSINNDNNKRASHSWPAELDEDYVDQVKQHFYDPARKIMYKLRNEMLLREQDDASTPHGNEERHDDGEIGGEGVASSTLPLHRRDSLQEVFIAAIEMIAGQRRVPNGGEKIGGFSPLGVKLAEMTLANIKWWRRCSTFEAAHPELCSYSVSSPPPPPPPPSSQSAYSTDRCCSSSSYYQLQQQLNHNNNTNNSASSPSSSASAMIVSWHFFWEIVQDQITELHELSASEYDASVAFPGPDHLLPLGMGSLVQSLAAEFAGLDSDLAAMKKKESERDQKQQSSSTLGLHHRLRVIDAKLSKFARASSRRVFNKKHQQQHQEQEQQEQQQQLSDNTAGRGDADDKNLRQTKLLLVNSVVRSISLSGARRILRKKKMKNKKMATMMAKNVNGGSRISDEKVDDDDDDDDVASSSSSYSFHHSTLSSTFAQLKQETLTNTAASDVDEGLLVREIVPATGEVVAGGDFAGKSVVIEIAKNDGVADARKGEAASATISADAVIVTVPLGVLKKSNLDEGSDDDNNDNNDGDDIGSRRGSDGAGGAKCSKKTTSSSSSPSQQQPNVNNNNNNNKNQLRFSPPLPRWFHRSVAALGCGSTLKITMQFPEVFWPASTHFFGILGDGIASFRNQQQQQQQQKRRRGTSAWSSSSSSPLSSAPIERFLFGSAEHIEIVNMHAVLGNRVLVLEMEADFAVQLSKQLSHTQSLAVDTELRERFVKSACGSSSSSSSSAKDPRIELLCTLNSTILSRLAVAFNVSSQSARFDHHLLLPTSIAIHNYIRDPFIGGCGFSFWPPGRSGDDNLAIAEPHWRGRLLFAGEHTSALFYANMHGAVMEGIRAAEAVLRDVVEPAIARKSVWMRLARAAIEGYESVREFALDAVWEPLVMMAKKFSSSSPSSGRKRQNQHSKKNGGGSGHKIKRQRRFRPTWCQHPCR